MRGVGMALAVLAGAGGVSAAMAMGGGGAPAAGTAPQAVARAASLAGHEAPGLAHFGNPDGHFPVPAAGRAVNTGHPNHVIGHGTPASCTSAAVVRAVAAGG